MGDFIMSDNLLAAIEQIKEAKMMITKSQNLSAQLSLDAAIRLIDEEITREHYVNQGLTFGDE